MRKWEGVVIAIQTKQEYIFMSVVSLRSWNVLDLLIRILDGWKWNCVYVLLLVDHSTLDEQDTYKCIREVHEPEKSLYKLII